MLLRFSHGIIFSRMQKGCCTFCLIDFLKTDVKIFLKSRENKETVWGSGLIDN